MIIISNETVARINGKKLSSRKITTLMNEKHPGLKHFLEVELKESWEGQQHVIGPNSFMNKLAKVICLEEIQPFDVNSNREFYLKYFFAAAMRTYILVTVEAMRQKSRLEINLKKGGHRTSPGVLTYNENVEKQPAAILSRYTKLHGLNLIRLFTPEKPDIKDILKLDAIIAGTILILSRASLKEK